MAREKIFVSPSGDRWKVQCEHCKSAYKATQQEAIKIARKHVTALAVGTLSQILVQATNGQFRAEWTYGKDPFPPKG